MIRMILRTLFCLFLAIALSGCRGNNDGKTVYPTTSVALSVGGADHAPSLRGPFVGTFADVTKVTVVISGKDKFGIDQNPLATVDLVKGAGDAWSAVVPDLPIGPALTFTARGYDASDVEIFSGVTVQVLTGSGDAVNIAMNPVSTGGSVLFPVITSIAVPAEVVVSSVASIAIGVTGGTGESLNYVVTSGGGTFDPATGTIALPSSTNGTINTNYTAPATPGALTHTVKVTNSQGNSVESDFNTTIVYSLGTSSMTVGFAPVVTALSGKRTGNDVSWTATVTDDKALSFLSYAWSFSQTAGSAGAAFSTADANPGVLSGYDQTVAGTITLSVTDGDGLSTTISFLLIERQFPDILVSPGGGSAMTAVVDGTWRVYHTPYGGSESSADTWAITSQAGNDANLSITSYNSGETFSGAVIGTNITASLSDYGDTVTLTGYVVPDPATKIGISMEGTYTSTSGETGTWRGANLAYVALLSLQVTPADAYVLVNGTTNFTATAIYSDGYEENVSNAAAWSSANGTIATMSGYIATGHTAGDVAISALFGSVAGNAALLHVTNGHSLGSLSGAWLVDSTADRNAGYDFFITDGNGAITSNSFYSSATPTYTVDSSGAFTLFIPQSGPSTMELAGVLTSFTTGNLSTAGLTNSTISKVSDRSLCQGAWSGSLSTGYGFVFTIKSDGMLDTAATRTISSGTIVSGAMVGQGSLCTGYFTTTLAEPYNAFRINGTLVTGPMTTLTGNFDNDSGSAWPVGTVSLTR